MNEKTKLDWMGRTLRAIRTAIRVRIYNFDSEVNFDDPIILEHLESLLHLTRQFTHVGNLIDELHTDDADINELAENLKEVVHNAKNRIVEAGGRLELAENSTNEVDRKKQFDLARASLQKAHQIFSAFDSGSVTPKALEIAETPCKNTEFILEIEIPENELDSNVVKDAILISTAIDELHRSLGGRGVKIEELEIFNELMVPEVTNG